MFTFFLGGLGARASIYITISSGETDYDLFVAAGSPINPVDVIITIDSAVDVIASATGVAGFDTGTGWAPTSTLTLINNGNIYGKGGVGGQGASVICDGCSSASVNGSSAGDAMNLQHGIIIDNTNGNVYGGGGGGGGGGGTYFDIAEVGAGGGGGGGGQSAGSATGGNGGTSSVCTVTNVNGSAGVNGSVSSSGAGGVGGIISGGAFGGTGGTGGDWGTAGDIGDAATGTGGFTFCIPASGGSGGKAIDLNGNSITWLGGNNGTQVKGAVS